MDWKGLIFLLLTIMSLHSSVFSCPEECECYHDINLYTANCSSFPTSNENELAKIEVFNLSPMSSVPLVLKEGQFVGFKKLKYLSLSNCSIYYIHKKAFYGLKNLIEIDLSFNDIQTLDSLVFQHSNDLTSLFLRGNPIKFTANTPFLVSNTIQHLDLGLSSIKNIPRGVFFGVKRIMYMSLDGNRLQTLKYNSLPRGLKYLNIANNMIINVPIELLTSLTNLHRLDLSGNPINCTCSLMDLQDWFSGRGVTFDNEVICASPPQYAGRSWNEVNENELCISETLIDDMQKKPLKKITKNGVKSKEKYFFTSDKNKYLETSALQADEPARFVDEKMDPNAEILFQNDDTLEMGVMMQDNESTKTEKPDAKLENNSEGGDATENDTNGSETANVEDENKKTAFDDIDSDDPGLEEENENKEDETEPANSVITPNIESNKHHGTDNGGMMSSQDELDTLAEIGQVSDEQNLQNDDVNNADSVKSGGNGGKDIIETPLTDGIKKETKEETESDSPPGAIQNAEDNRKEPIPVEEHEEEYDKAASEELLTGDLIPPKKEKQNSRETNPNPVENTPDDDESKAKEPINKEDKVNEANVKEIEGENNEGNVLLTGEINNKPQNEIQEEVLRSESVESAKEKLVPANSESENKHLSHGSALDKDLLTQEDLIEPAHAISTKEEDTSDIDSTEEPVKNVDENNIDTGVIVDNGEKLEEKLGQIKAAESIDEHDKIENSDLKPESEYDLTPNENLFVGNTDQDTNTTVVSASNETSNVKDTGLDESSSNSENTAVVGDLIGIASEEKVNQSVINSNDSVGNAITENNVAEESVDKSIGQDNVNPKNETESIAVSSKIEKNTAPESSKAEDADVPVVVETDSEFKNESEVIKTDDHIESIAEEKLGNLVAVNKSSEEPENEKEIEAITEPIDSKESFKSKLNEEMFIADVSDEINSTETDGYDISTTQTPDVLVPVEESVQNETLPKADIETINNITETDISEKNDTSVTGIADVPEPTEEVEFDEQSKFRTVSEPTLTEQNVSAVEIEPHDHEPEHEEVTTGESTTDIPEVTPGETTSGNDTNFSLVDTDRKPNADMKENLKHIPEDEVLQEPEPFELQEAHIVLACVLVLVLALVLFSVYKCALNKNKSTKRITKDIESNHGTEMQDMASLLPKPSEDDNKSTKKYPEDASSNEKVKLITEEKEEDDNQYQRGNETQAVVEKENTLNNNAPNSPNKPTPVNRTVAPTTINPAAPIQRTKVKVAIIPESIPRTPIFVQKTYNNGVSTNG